ncbi:MAG TPA: EcsC family protein [Bryobacteraceae bacterium]|jgi:hypothetical protein
MARPLARLTATDHAKLTRAVTRLEKNSLVAMLARAVGRPVTALLGALPNFANDAIQKVTKKAVLKCLRIALNPRSPRSIFGLAAKRSKLISGIVGGVGGLLGLPGVLIELPVTTLLMFQSIAQIAAAEGEDLNDPTARLACLEVFALSSDGRGPASRQDGYYKVRDDLSKSLEEASEYVLQRSSALQTGPSLLQFASFVAARFGVLVSEELAVAAIPVVGAVTGASLNVVFMQHFEDVARGHFAVRALERKYGEQKIRVEFEQIRADVRRPRINSTH